MKINSKISWSVRATLAGIALMTTGAAFADSVALSDESGQASDTVTVTFTYTGDGSQFALQAEAVISNPGAFSSIDASNLCSGSTANTTSCTFDGTDRLQILASNGSSNPLQDFTGTAEFTIAAGASLGTIDLTWDTAGTFTPDSGTDGSIEVVSGPQSTLTLSTTSVAFGPVDINNLPQTALITAENDGQAGSSLTFQAGTGYTGPAEFTVQSDGCSGQSLAQNETCDVVIEFESATATNPPDGTFSFVSDANTNPNQDVTISGEATSMPVLSVNPPFGPVPLGTVVVGQSTTANGSVSNSGSAEGDFSCALTGDTTVISTTPDLAGPITVPAGGSVDFSLTCAIPDTAAEGDTFNATLTCSNDLNGTHEISCGATEFVQIPVPTMNKVGLGILALLMVMIGGLTVRFFRT